MMDERHIAAAAFLKQLREDRGATLRELHKFTGVNFRSLNRYERGETKIPYHVARILSRKFQKPLRMFFPEAGA